MSRGEDAPNQRPAPHTVGVPPLTITQHTASSRHRREADYNPWTSLSRRYAVANDVSGRSWQFDRPNGEAAPTLKKPPRSCPISSPPCCAGGQWVRSKCFDTFFPLSPMVPAESIVDPQGLVIQTTINGQVVQKCSTSDMLFSVRSIMPAADCTALQEHDDLSRWQRAHECCPGTGRATGCPCFCERHNLVCHTLHTSFLVAISTTLSNGLPAHSQVAEIIEFLSISSTLLPGTLISTGTPVGVGHTSNPQRYLREWPASLETVESRHMHHR